MNVKRFEDLIAWQKARALTRSIYQTTNAGAFAKDAGLRSQIQRASVSVMSNICEGFERNNLKEFYRFLMIAKASCGEVRCQLYVALDTGYMTQAQFDDLNMLASEVARMIGGLAASVKRKSQNSPNRS